jgi:D-amino-acid oxidase
MESATGQWLKDLLSTSPWFKDIVPDFKVLPTKDLPSGIDSATSFTSMCINVAIYLPYLVSQCVKNGVVLRNTVLSHISDAASLHHSGRIADVVVNCTGLLACKLGGVMDKDVFPIRGQVVHVRNDPGVMMSTSGTDDGEDEICYIMKRALGGGTVLGGTYQKCNWDSQPSPEQASRIMKRAVELCPKLTGGKGVEALDVISHWVGLRPYRTGGARIEKERINGCWIVHNYGHGGWGYQASYGCSEEAKDLVASILATEANP